MIALYWPELSVRTVAILLENLSAIGIIGCRGNRSQRQYLCTKSKAGIIIVMSSRGKATIRMAWLMETRGTGYIITVSLEGKQRGCLLNCSSVCASKKSFHSSKQMSSSKHRSRELCGPLSLFPAWSQFADLDPPEGKGARLLWGRTWFIMSLTQPCFSQRDQWPSAG